MVQASGLPSVQVANQIVNAGSVSQSTLISAIVPTIGRPQSLTRLLHSLSIQTRKVDEVIVADASGDDETEVIARAEKWEIDQLRVTYVRCHLPNAVQQRNAAIELSTGDYLLFLDDDVTLEPDCVEEMLQLFRAHPEAAGITADFNNQSWPQPTRLWRFYLTHLKGMPADSWQGRVVGPLLRFGYNPIPEKPRTIEWLGTGNSLLRKSAFNQTGGFSDFFLHRSTINEDVDLSLKLKRIGPLLFCPAAKLSHHHAPEGRVSRKMAAEDDLFNRYFILTRTLHNKPIQAFGSVAIYITIETTSQLLGALQRLNFEGFLDRLMGHVCALWRILNQPALNRTIRLRQ